VFGVWCLVFGFGFGFGFAFAFAFGVWLWLCFRCSGFDLGFDFDLGVDL